MKSWFGLAVAGFAMALSACSPPHPHHGSNAAALKTVDALDCPATEGALKLDSGVSGPGPCVYSGDGNKVTLTLVKVTDGDTKAALAPFQAAAQAELPTLAPSAGGASVDTSATTSSGDGDDRADIDLPGIHIHTNGGKATVNAMGVHVNADDSNGHHAVITTPGGSGHDRVTVNAGDGGARIEVDEKGSGVRSIFLLASDKPGANGWRSAGYQARGPESGPLVVATILSKRDHDEDLRGDVKRLLRRNVGG